MQNDGVTNSQPQRHRDRRDFCKKYLCVLCVLCVSVANIFQAAGARGAPYGVGNG